MVELQSKQVGGYAPNFVIRDLESLCADHIDPLLHCEETLELVAIDIASVCTDGAEWPIIRKMVTEAGIEISDDLDKDLSQL